MLSALQVLGLNFQRSRRKCEQLSHRMTHSHDDYRMPPGLCSPMHKYTFWVTIVKNSGFPQKGLIEHPLNPLNPPLNTDN